MSGPYLELSGGDGGSGGGDGKRQVPLGKTPLTIGRHADNVLVLAESMASRFHCVVEPVPEGYRLRDLGSKNGTRINGNLVKSALLLDGDVIAVGATTLRLSMPDAPGARLQIAKKRPAGAAAADDDDAEEITEEDAGDTDGVEEIGEDALVEEDPNDPNSDPVKVLVQLANSLPDKSIQVGDITMINARGGVAHANQADTRRDGADPPREAVALMQHLLLVCFRIHATDIHVEPKNDDYQVRIRVDGNMVDAVRLSKEMGVRLTSLVKILSDIDISQKNIVQEGHFATRVPDRRVDYRVSFAPAIFGQKLVVRVFDTANTPLHLWDMQLPKWMYESIEKSIQQDAGMVLVCGPTGSGKTTTLYSLLRSIDMGQRNVVTIEDPVEIQLEGVTQIPVNDQQGNTFAGLLRSVLRQDPDVILVGEIRDPETARIAMQAAMTGHLVFSTVHSRDSVGTIFRLLDLGVEPYMVAQGLHLVLAQRLVRQLCPHCRTPVVPTAAQIARLGPAGENVTTLYNPAGCSRCLNTGFAGRQAVFELLTTNESLREVILRKPSLQDIHTAMTGTKFERLLQTGYQLVADGTTSMSEVEHAIGSERALT